MKNIKISPALKNKVTNVAIGALEAEVKVKPSPQELIELLNAEAKTIGDKEQLEDIAMIPHIHDTREAYKMLGKKPARYRVSSEALHRRIVQGKGLYFINNAVDITNLVSIRSGFGICLYDASKISNELSFRIASEGETYRGIGKFDLNLENLPVFSDDQGPFGSPTSDSERTMVTPETRKILFSIVSFSDNSQMEKWLEESKALFKKWAEGENLRSNIFS